MKWRILVFGVILIGITSTAGAPPRRSGRSKLKYGKYEIQFGTWPLMEITDLSKNRPKYKPLGGFMQNAIQSNLKHPVGVKFNHGFNKIRGPPPPRGQRGRFPRPGSIKLSNPEIFVDLQAPILHPPPRSIPIAIPVGMPLIQTGNNNPQPILIQGPPPPQQFPQLQFSPNYIPQTTKAPPPPQLSTIMGKAAYSGFFGKDKPVFNRYYNSFPPGPPPLFHGPPQGYRMQQSHTIHSSSNYRPGQPSFGPPAYAQPQVVMGDLAPSASERFQVERVPQVPPVIKIGGHPPEGYSMTHGEQQLVTLKLPDTTMSRKMDSASLLRGAEYTYGADIRRRQDNQGGNILKPGQHPNQHQQTYQEDKKLPDVGAIYTVNMVLQTPNISAPTNGSQSPHFQQGMNEMHRIYGSNNKKQSPLDAQVKLLGKLFTELQRLKPPKVDVEPVETIIHYKKDSTDPFGTESQRYYTPPKVDAPLMAIHIQSYSVPEPGSADPDVLESARMFGLQGHRIDFGNTNEIINLMDTAQKAVSKRIPIDELGYTRGEVNHNLQEWVKGYVTLTRKMKDQAHAKGEGIANQSFRQHQYHMKMFDQSMQPMDPKIFTQGASITNAGAVATYQG